MLALRRRLRFDVRADDGLTLIEILVAMMIFAFISVGVAMALTASLAAARDNRSRITAASLAAAEIDRVRAIGDPFKVHDVPSTAIGPSNAFTLTTDTSWVSASGADATCGTSGGPLQYKLVTVTVKWTGARSNVTSDTLIAPTGRINDPKMGTILVAVKNAIGTGSAGVSFTAGSLDTTATDSDGCSYVLKVPPGNYTVTLSQPGYIDYLQNVSPSQTLPVTAGAATSYSFQYDKAGKFTIVWGSGSPVPLLPTNLDTTFLNTTLGAFAPMKVSTTTKIAQLHPYKEGYQAVAGAYRPSTCATPNPTEWAPDTRATPALVGKLNPSIAAAPGGSATLQAPMGLATISPGSEPFLTAVSQPVAAVPGEPVCNTTMTYDFGSVIPTSGAGVRIALPYGTWQLYSRTSATGAMHALTGGRVTRVSSGIYTSSSGALTLDPRQ